MANKIRVKQLEALAVGEWLSDGDARGGGQLYARRLAGGPVAFYFRLTLPNGKRDVLRIGEWSERGDGNFLLSLTQARTKAAELRDRYQSGERDLRSADAERLAEEGRQKRASQEQTAREHEAGRRRAELTLGALLAGYVEVLSKAGKASAHEVEKSLIRNIREPFPKLWAAPVDDVDEDRVSVALDRLTEADKLREAAKLRSYLRAAFSAAVRARKPGGPTPLRRFGIRVNPLRDMPTIDGASGVRERALSVEELRAYWKAINKLPEPYGALLRFHLLTGGQRVEQLSRLTTRDVDGEAVILSDPKGRRDKPRRHLVPLIPVARAALDAMATPRMGPHLLTVTNGETAAGYDVLGRYVRKVAADMVDAGKALEPFTPGDLRRTVETRLAALAVSTEVRANLQSHGLSGVQQRHYNVHDYANEKREALERLYRLATGAKESNVTALRKRR